MHDPLGAPSCVAVDLTPVLPGGDNGGAKVFALELVTHLARLAPTCRFILLTQAASHEELASLDADNVRRVQVLGPAASSGRTRAFGLASRALSPMPAWIRRRVAGAGYRVFALLKRGSSPRLLRDMGAQLLFCPFTAPTFREPGIPVVATIYDVQYRAYPQFFSVEDAAQRDRAFLEACRESTRLAAISDYSRTSAIATGAVEPGRIRTIHLQRGVASVTPDAPAAMVRGPISPPYLFYPANFWRHKNHEMLLTAYGIARRAGLPNDLKLVLTGAPGERQEELKCAAAKMGLADHVVFAGFVSPEDYRALLAGARGLVFPSLYEGFGLPVVEAMAAGVPVACSDTTSLPEVAGEATLLFDPRLPSRIAEAMVALATDEALRARLAGAGRDRASRFTRPEAMAQAYWSLFAEALAHRNDRAAA